MNDVQFYGQQDGERVLYEVQPHKMLYTFQMVRAFLMGFFIIFLFTVFGIAVPDFRTVIIGMGVLLGTGVAVVGLLVTQLMRGKTKAFITDRRIIRFTSGTPWASSSRSLSWDEVVKVKTNSPSFWLRSFNVGNVIVHARTTILPGSSQEEQRRQEQTITNDDIALEGVEYYQDLGNYMDKVLYLYKKEPEELKKIRVFVAKPRGQRY